MKLQTLPLSEIPHLRVLGRTGESLTPLSLFWTASGLEVNVQAKELWVHVHVEYEIFEPWVNILVDGALTQRLMLTKGDRDICVLRTTDPYVTRNIRILRDTQAMPGDPDMLLQITGLSCDGTYLPVKEPALRLEFIGDSITSGEGLCGAPAEMDWVPASFNCIESYAHLTAAELGADYHVISQCGWGVYCNYEGKTEETIPPYYEQICGVTKGGEIDNFDAGESWDFHRFQPHAVIINLGTNDAGAINNPEIAVQDPALIEESAYRFLQKVRLYNPDTWIVWCLGMLGDTLCDIMKNAVERYRQDTGDTRCDFLRLPDTGKDEFGSRNHPGKSAHIHAARVLTDYLRSLTL